MSRRDTHVFVLNVCKNSQRIEESKEMIYQNILLKKAQGKKSLAVLIDPDKHQKTDTDILSACNQLGVDYIFVGGSFIHNEDFHKTIQTIKQKTEIPIIIFPGDTHHIDDSADAILLLSMISGRNPELLIGKHVQAAQKLKDSRLEVIPTGYMLIDGGKFTSVAYISQTIPIPSDKTEIALSTAMAGEMLGLKIIYMDAGSGATQSVPSLMVKEISSAVNLPLIVGGGIRNPETMQELFSAGADIIVVGNALEENPEMLWEMAMAREG